MNTKEVHPVELLILAAVVTLEAVLVLAVALVALLPAVAGRRSVAGFLHVEERRVPPAPAPAPALHPLAAVALDLEALPAVTLRTMAGTRSRRARKAELIALVAACC